MVLLKLIFPQWTLYMWLLTTSEVVRGLMRIIQLLRSHRDNQCLTHWKCLKKICSYYYELVLSPNRVMIPLNNNRGNIFIVLNICQALFQLLILTHWILTNNLWSGYFSCYTEVETRFFRIILSDSLKNC